MLFKGILGKHMAGCHLGASLEALGDAKFFFAFDPSLVTPWKP